MGAQNAFVLKQGLQQKHVGLVVSLCISGDIVLIVSGVSGAGALVQRWGWLIQLLRFGGAAFLVVYGTLAALRALRGSAVLIASDSGMMSWKSAALATLAFTFLNPHVYLDTVILLGGISTRYVGSEHSAFAVGACIASVVWFSSLGYGAKLLQPIFRSERAWRVLDTVMALFMYTLAFMLLTKPLGGSE